MKCAYLRHIIKFYNLPNNDKESWEESQRKVRKYISDKLTLDESKIEIQRAHRLQGRNRPRPVIVKFSRHKDKDLILKKYKSYVKQREQTKCYQ